MKMWLLVNHLVIVSFTTCLSEFTWHRRYGHGVSEEDKGFGPIFEEQPINTIYPEESPEGKVSLNCRARASPFPVYKWRMNNGDIDLTSDRYSMVGGNLVINNPDKQKDAGVYYCLASNNYGMVRSTEATLSFGYLDPFPPEERPEVRVKEGKGMVLLCDPPYHFPDDLSYRWLLNEFPVFITMDKRRFVSQTNGNLYIANVEASDKGNYSCFVSSPSITKSVFSKFIPLIPLPERTTKPYPADIVVQFKDIYALMGQNVTLECFALGNPVPDIRWRKVLEPMPSTAEISTSGAVLKIFNIQLEDEGTYECEAENIRGKDKHQARIYVQEEFPKSNLLQKLLLRIVIWEDGSLEINNITRNDGGVYTCFVENNKGKANSTGTLVITDPTRIILAPINADITVGENATMQCAASFDPALDLTFVWSFNGYVIDFNKENIHYQRNFMLDSNGELLIRNAQLKHAGRYTCTAQTIVDNSSASADLVVRGPPGPPGGLRIEDVRATSVGLTWSRGSDNHSPISKYTIQTKTILSDDWKDAKTDPSIIEGNMEAARAVDLIPWMEYEFRVLATNTLGIGEPSIPSSKIKTDGAAPNVAPSDVGGGGGSNRELTITWAPLSREYHYGNNFGYIVAFKPFDGEEWKKVTVTNPDTGRYVHKDETMRPSTAFQVKVKAFNNKGDGPYSLTAVIHSAQDAPSEAPTAVGVKVLSSSEISVHWEHVVEKIVESYQIRYWAVHDKEAAAHRVQVTSQEYSARLENLLPDTQYFMEVRACNSAGCGPPSDMIETFTKKAPPSQPPRIISSIRSGSRYIITWDHVVALSNESTVTGYKVLYRPDGQHDGKLYSTHKHSIEVPIPRDGEYVVEVRAHSDGGDGVVSQVKISGASILSPCLLGFLLPALGILVYLEF
ncbi:PREDICTED: contactin-1-like [Lipotes vexillifer]|uniref:Contactin-1 n=1 Tax=Lipotes vexillifer TaxID=118797 RepID=A0A340XW11_LIPVE|nr:PREDICTED: contactin-1-like [Lipotes vexillifer]